MATINPTTLKEISLLLHQAGALLVYMQVAPVSVKTDDGDVIMDEGVVQTTADIIQDMIGRVRDELDSLSVTTETESLEGGAS